jgi:hypothetical protein
MSSANPFHIDFPTRPTLVFREEGKVTYVDDKGEAASICLTTKDMSPLEAAVIYQRRGMDDIRMFAGPSEKVIPAFRDFETRASDPLIGSRHSVDPIPPRRLTMNAAAAGIGAAVVAILAFGAGSYLANTNRPADPQSTAKVEMLEKLAKQVEQMSGDPNRPAPGAAAEAPPLMAPGGPLNFKPAKVKQVGSDAAAPAASPQPAPGVVPVPKELPSLPRAEAATTVDVAALTDVLPARETAGPVPKITVAVGEAPAISVEPVPSQAQTAATKIDAGKDAKPEAKSGDKAPDGKDGEKVAPTGVSPMSPAEAQELLKTLEQIKSQAAEGGELTPELLKQLPMDVARRLVGTGIATVSPQERSERAQRMARIVRLPANVINNYRGRDGIASIPEQDTWVANGGRITIPLPGGGDVLEPGILKEFGLAP